MANPGPNRSSTASRLRGGVACGGAPPQAIFSTRTHSRRGGIESGESPRASALGAPTGYLVGCSGCGRLFMLDQPTKRTAPKGWIGPPHLTSEPFFCTGCAAKRSPAERCDCGCTLRPAVCSCEIWEGS